MYRTSRNRRARRNVKEPSQVHGMGADRGKRHHSLSSQQSFAQWRRMRKGAGHGGVW